MSWSRTYPEPAMPALIKHPEVATGFYTFPASLAGGWDDPVFRTTMYEDGQVLLADGPIVHLSPEEWAVIDTLRPAPTEVNWLKKAKYTALVAPFAPGASHVLDHCCPGDRATAAKVQAVIVRETEKLRQYVRRVFPTYRFVGENITWRFTPTEREPMHYDSYGSGHDEIHRVRLFVNLDTIPRLWGLSHHIREMIPRYPVLSRKFAWQHPNDFNNSVSLELPWAEVPRHLVAFPHGGAWLVNTQLVAHEIIFGCKLIACTFEVDPASMQDRTKSFVPVVRQTLSELPQ